MLRLLLLAMCAKRLNDNNKEDQTFCFGYCADCGETHTLPAAQAIPHCDALMQQLKEQGRIDFETPAPDADPHLSTAGLYSDSLGKMFGILVCEDAQGQEVILRAFSAKHNGVWDVAGWVPPLVDIEQFEAEIVAGNIDIHPLTALIDTLEKGSALWKAKVAERKKVSHRVLTKLYALYKVHNFKGEQRTLAQAFYLKKGIPNGTGDCCAPKLLNHAAKNKLKPISMAEFFWGKSPASKQRVEGHFYASCTDKCQPILGFMLCGSNNNIFLK